MPWAYLPACRENILQKLSGNGQHLLSISHVARIYVISMVGSLVIYMATLLWLTYVEHLQLERAA